jgi:hypothetical protein
MRNDMNAQQRTDFHPVIPNASDRDLKEVSFNGELWGERLARSSRQEISRQLHTVNLRLNRMTDVLSSRGYETDEENRWIDPNAQNRLSGWSRRGLIPQNRYDFKKDSQFDSSYTGSTGMGDRTQSEPNLASSALDYSYAEPTRYANDKRARTESRTNALKRAETLVGDHFLELTHVIKDSAYGLIL